MRRLTSFGLLVALILGFTGCSAPVVGNDTIKVTALLADSAGLFVGNDVGVLGVPVGKVTDITPDGPNVRVTLEVDADRPVPATAGAVVVARSVATDRYVELTPVYTAGDRMQDGAVIEQSKTRTPVDFDDVLGALNTFATGIVGTKETQNAIKNLLESGADALGGRGSQVNRAITALGAAVNSISGQRGNITGTIRSLDVLTGSIAANEQLGKEFITQVSRASSLLAGERKNFRASLTALSDAVASIADFAHTNRQELVKALEQSGQVMTSVRVKEKELLEVLRVMPLTLQNLRNIYRDGRIQVRLDPLVITPLGEITDTLCRQTETQFCAALGPALLNLQNLLSLLGVGR